MLLSTLDLLQSQDLVLIDDFISGHELKFAQEFVSQEYEKGHFRDAKIGAGQHTQLAQNIRSDETHWINWDQFPELEFLVKKLSSIQDYTNRQFNLGINESEFHWAHYRPGASYNAHFDRSPTFTSGAQNQSKGERILSCVLYLNKSWNESDGGEFCWHEKHAEDRILQKIMPLGGRLVVFLANEVLHSVAPAKRDRWSLTGWFRRDPLMVLNSSFSIMLLPLDFYEN